METSKISLQARGSSTDLSLHFWFDGCKISEMSLTPEWQDFVHEFPDEESDHVFEIELCGKKSEHTVIDEQGTIVSDVIAEIGCIALDDIELGHVFSEQSQYHHDHNGSTDALQAKFFGIMGCNGRVILRFHSPVYLWLLENT